MDILFCSECDSINVNDNDDDDDIYFFSAHNILPRTFINQTRVEKKNKTVKKYFCAIDLLGWDRSHYER